MQGGGRPVRVPLLWPLQPVLCFHELAQTPPLKPDGFVVLLPECDPTGGDHSAKPSIFLRDPTTPPQGDRCKRLHSPLCPFSAAKKNCGPKRKKLHFFSFVLSDLCIPPPNALAHQRKQSLRTCDVSEENVAISFPFGVGTWRGKGVQRNPIRYWRQGHLPLFYHVRSLF